MKLEASSGSVSTALKLSICITTVNRAKLLGATLEGILAQLTNECEVVVVDGASTDNTQDVVSRLASRFERLHYFRQDVNNGFDRDCNRSVELANGQYCWLMTDDDLLKPGAIEAVLNALSRDLSFLFINVEGRTFDMSEVVEERCLDHDDDRLYKADEMDRLFEDLGGMLSYVGAVVIKRDLWLARQKEQYYGSMFVHVGVIFQERLPGEALVLAEPLISYRMGNVHTWSSRTFETFMIKWPEVVWSLPLSASAKYHVCRVEPWRSFQQLLNFRGRGHYSLTEYRRYVRPRLRTILEMSIPALVAILPGVIVNAAWLVYYSLVKCQRRGLRLQFMRESRYYFWNWRLLRRII